MIKILAFSAMMLIACDDPGTTASAVSCEEAHLAFCEMQMECAVVITERDAEARDRSIRDCQTVIANLGCPESPATCVRLVDAFDWDCSQQLNAEYRERHVRPIQEECTSQ